MKLVEKHRAGARLRRYDAPRTPLERVAACADVDPATGQALQQLQARLDPFGLRRRATPAAKVTTGTT